MAILARLKEWIDWSRRIEFIARMVYLVIALAASATAAGALLHTFSRIPNIWHLPIYLGSVCIGWFLFVLVAYLWKRRKLPAGETRRIVDEVKWNAGRAAMLWFIQARATELENRLEEVWHHWNYAGERLVHPLDITIDKLKDYSADAATKLINEHREFLVLYANHLSSLKAEFPEFTSPIVEAGYPANCEYHVALANMKAHIEKLGEEAQRIWGKY